MKLYSNKNPLRLAITVAAVLGALAGCHDSKNGNSMSTPLPSSATPAATSEVPASASSTVADFISYLKLLVVAVADTLEPVDVSTVAAKTDDTIEPAAVD